MNERSVLCLRTFTKEECADAAVTGEHWLFGVHILEVFVEGLFGEE